MNTISLPTPELTRDQKLKLIYRHTHRDYKWTGVGVRGILVNRGGAGTCLVPITQLTEAEVADKLPYALKKEADRLAAK